MNWKTTTKPLGLLALALMATAWPLLAQNGEAAPQDIEMADALYESGKIYIVVIVIAVIFVGLLGYLLYLDLKMRLWDPKGDPADPTILDKK